MGVNELGVMERLSTQQLLGDDQVEYNFLKTTPDFFLIVGKPGSGKTTLAKNFSSLWNCCLINDTSVLSEVIAEETELGKDAKCILERGEEISEKFMADIVLWKLQTATVQNYGYVLDCFPSLCEGWKSIRNQLDHLKEISLGPSVIINLKITDQELEQRRLDIRVDPKDEKLYLHKTGQSTQPTFDVPETKDGDADSANESDDNDENNAENDEEEDDDDDIFAEALNTIGEDGFSLLSSSPQLIRRERDLNKHMDEEIMFYNNSALKPLEDFIVEHNRQFVIDLDANLPPKELLKSLLIHLDSLGISCCPIPQQLFEPDDEEDDDFEGLDSEQFLQKLRDVKNVYPKFRWRASKWGRYCPVQLARGNLLFGKREHSVGYLDKVYCLSSEEALKQFTANPRFYLLPPFPCLPCKVCVLGPPTSGKSTLSKLLAQHYNAMVLNIQQLLIPVITKEKVKLIDNARQDAINKFLADHEGEEIDETEAEKHPDVVKVVEEAATSIDAATITVTQEMYMEALRNGICMAEERKRENNPNGPKFGGWIIDSFPMERENWIAMNENDLTPDFVVALDDEEAPIDYLLSRFTKLHKLPYSGADVEDSEKKKEEEEATSVKVPELVTKWKNAKSNYNNQWNQLIASIKGSAIDPIVIDCTLPLEDVVNTAVKQMEGVFEHKPVEYTYEDEDADADDDPSLNYGSEDADVDEATSSTESKNFKPWGTSGYFCPVALKNNYTLWPGNNELLLRYREKLYCFSSDEAKEKFLSAPTMYSLQQDQYEVPPLRCFLIGPKSSGKTVLGRHLAKTFGVFHISFRELLQEQILPKMKKPPLIDSDEWDSGESEPQEESENDTSDLDPDVKIPLTLEEADIRAYLLNESNLNEEQLQKFLQPFWCEEPYKSTGFVLEGFPSKPDEMRFLADNGWYPDVAIILQVEESYVINRILPFRLESWITKRNRRMDKAKSQREQALKEWEEDKAQRINELKNEYDKKANSNEEDDEGSDAYHEEFLEQLAEIKDEEPPELDLDEEEESEIEATERMKSSIIEQYEEQVDSISSLQDVFAEVQVSFTSINGCKKPKVVQFCAEKSLLPYTVNRQGLLTKCTPINAEIAKKLLDQGYKYLSPFKKWCPVKLLRDPHSVLPPKSLLKSQQFPVIYCQHIYFPSSTQNRTLFIQNPHKYISQAPPGYTVPVRLAIVGPPKSGKTTVAKKFCDEYGCIRLSIGEVLRRITSKFPNSKLSQLIESHLRSGQTVPEDLCVYALESALLEVQCCTRGFVLDGWPASKSQVDLLNKFHIIPVCIVELKISETDVLKRGEKDRFSSDRLYPVHDSDSILLLRSKHYYDNLEDIKNWYIDEHDNWNVIDGTSSKWKVWKECNDVALFSARQIQQYMERSIAGKAASINGLCVTPSDFKSNLGEFSQYCPVSLALQGELVDCSAEKSLKYAASYRGKYYNMGTYEDLQLFLTKPTTFVPPEAPHELPPTSQLPQRKSSVDIKSQFPKKFEANGFCSVCYTNGGKQYESLQPGCPEFSAEYCDKLYCFCSEQHLEKFMRKPQDYQVGDLPTKLPPLKQASPITSLPMLGYMEQTVATTIIEALSVTGAVKPKFPFFSSTKSALYYVGLYLKAFNPNTGKLIRQKYKKKLLNFEEQCKLIDYLSINMHSGYKEPFHRPLGFRKQMNDFMLLKN